MLHILLVILKILGIILACVLGLLLLLVLIVLFVPIRYRVDAKKREDIIIKMRVNWLLGIVFLRGWFIDKQLHIKLRIFGFTFYDNLKPKKEKVKKVKKTKTKKSKSKKEKVKSKNSDLNSKKESASKESDKKEEIVLPPSKEDSINEKPHEIENVQHKLEEKHVEAIEEKHVESKEEHVQLNKEIHVEVEDNSEEQNQSGKIGKFEALRNKIKAFFDKIKGIFQKISKLGSTIKTKVNQIVQLVKKLFEKKSLVSVFLADEMNKAGIKIAFGQLLAVLKHCGPQRVEGYVKFGTGDPESTGKLLGVAAIFYGKYGKNVTIEPDFEEKVFEAEGMVKGRIRIFSLLIIGIKVIRDKNFKKLLKNARQLKEEL